MQALALFGLRGGGRIRLILFLFPLFFLFFLRRACPGTTPRPSSFLAPSPRRLRKTGGPIFAWPALFFAGAAWKLRLFLENLLNALHIYITRNVPKRGPDTSVCWWNVVEGHSLTYSATSRCKVSSLTILGVRCVHKLT